MLKYIFTLGPASSCQSIIADLLDCASAFRLNSSHLTCRQLDYWLEKIKKVFLKTGENIPVIIDLQGAKMRIGKIATAEMLPEKVKFIFDSNSIEDGIIPVPHRDFFSSLDTGIIVALNDLKVRAKIISCSENYADAVVIKNGYLASNKGINIEKHPVNYNALTEKDNDIIRCSMKYKFTDFAFSFLYDGDEADIIRPLIENRKLIAKIERVEAFNHLKNIAAKFDEIWLCRGDLGAQAGIYNLGRLQDEFIKKIPIINKECILAGQVLEHMTHFPNPTRSEVVHLYDTEKNGFTGIVLSDETAIGNNPLAVANFLKGHNHFIRTDKGKKYT